MFLLSGSMSMKEKSNDKDTKSAAHALIQARGGQTGLVRKKNGGGKSKAGGG